MRRCYPRLACCIFPLLSNCSGTVQNCVCWWFYIHSSWQRRLIITDAIAWETQRRYRSHAGVCWRKLSRNENGWKYDFFFFRFLLTLRTLSTQMWQEASWQRCLGNGVFRLLDDRFPPVPLRDSRKVTPPASLAEEGQLISWSKVPRSIWEEGREVTDLQWPIKEKLQVSVLWWSHHKLIPALNFTSANILDSFFQPTEGFLDLKITLEPRVVSGYPWTVMTATP